MPYLLALPLLAHPAASDLLADHQAALPAGAFDPGMMLQRRDGSVHLWSRDHALEAAQSPGFMRDMAKLWTIFEIVTVGDALKRVGGLDKAPDLELLRHLRNGIAHGNRFHFIGDEPTRPAHFTGSEGRLLPDGQAASPHQGPLFNVTRDLEGQEVLFDFMGPGDVHDLLMFVSWRLYRVANGDEPQDLWPQREPP
jgi:hypothetical protein